MTEDQFPKPPDWEKVQKHTETMLDVIHNNDLTFTEKNAILSMVRASVDREFGIQSIILWMEKMYKDEMERSSKNPEHFQ